MPVEVRQSAPLHRPGDATVRPKGILKNPSFSGPSGRHSPEKEDHITDLLPPAPLDPQESKVLTHQNTLHNAGHRRSSSAARRVSASRRQSSVAGTNPHDDAEQMRLKWDEANLYLHEQEAGGRMKITEPKTPYQFGEGPMDEDEGEEDVSINPRFVNVDEVDLGKSKSSKKPKGNDIPGLELGEPEDEGTGADLEDDRIVRVHSLSRENSKEKHVSVSNASGDGGPEQVGLPTKEEQEKHRQFEEARKKHYEMSSVKNLLGHPENIDLEEEEDDDDNELSPGTSTDLPNRGINGGP